MVFQHTVKHHIDISALSINTTRTKISVYKIIDFSHFAALINWKV